MPRTDAVPPGPAELDDDPGGSVIPRLQAGGSPQHLLVTLLGDYWFSREELLPASSIKMLLEDFGITSTGARTTLSRLTRRGSLVAERRGRNSYFALSPDARSRMRAGFERIVLFGSADPTWDGTWTVATFTTPEDQRDVRSMLRHRLRWLGFAPLFDGVWISPSADAIATRATFDDLGLSGYAVFHAAHGEAGTSLAAPWQIESLHEKYSTFIKDGDRLADRLTRGDVTASEALIARTEIMDTWRSFPSQDPDLPAELLPSDWPRHHAWQLFVRLYEGLGPLAELRVRQCVGAIQPELESLIERRSILELIPESSRKRVGLP